MQIGLLTLAPALIPHHRNTCALFYSVPLFFTWWYLGNISVMQTGIPTIAASAVWHSYHTQRSFVTVWWPVSAMILFCLHPSASIYYAASWGVILVCGFFSDTHHLMSLYVRALVTTLTAHSVGSLLFIYSVPTVPEFWINLLPLVAYERTRNACALFIVAVAIRLLKKSARAVSVYSHVLRSFSA